MARCLGCLFDLWPGLNQKAWYYYIILYYLNIILSLILMIYDLYYSFRISYTIQTVHLCFLTRAEIFCAIRNIYLYSKLLFCIFKRPFWDFDWHVALYKRQLFSPTQMGFFLSTSLYIYASIFTVDKHIGLAFSFDQC